MNTRTYECNDCHGAFSQRQLIHGICNNCLEKRLAIQREDARRAYQANLEKYNSVLKNCKTGVCDTLHMHHDLLLDDSERLKTDFLIGIICGEDMKKKYQSKTMGGKIV